MYIHHDTLSTLCGMGQWLAILPSVQTTDQPQSIDIAKITVYLSHQNAKANRAGVQI